MTREPIPKLGDTPYLRPKPLPSRRVSAVSETPDWVNHVVDVCRTPARLSPVTNYWNITVA
jgi:hypothetical protein